MFEPGDPFKLSILIDNHGQAVFCEQYIFLNIGGSYWFWPTWTQDIDSLFLIHPPGLTEREILNFVWPDVEGSRNDLAVYALLCKPGSYEMMSNLASVSFGYR